MAVQNSATTDSVRQERRAENAQTIDLRRFGFDLPAPAAQVRVTIGGDASRYVVDVDRKHKWTIHGTGPTAVVTAVYEAGRAVAPPERVPEWLEAVLFDLDVDGLQIDEVTI